MVMNFIKSWFGEPVQKPLSLSEANAPDGPAANALRAIEAAEPGSVSHGMALSVDHMYILGQQLEAGEAAMEQGLVHVKATTAYLTGVLDATTDELADIRAEVEAVQMR